MEGIVFGVLAALALAGALMVVASAKVIHGIFALVATSAAAAGLFALLQAPFVALAQLVLHAGLGLVLFLSALALGRDRPQGTRNANFRGAGALGTLLLVATLVGVLGGRFLLCPPAWSPGTTGTAAAVGELLFGPWLPALAALALAALAALLGAVALTRGERK